MRAPVYRNLDARSTFLGLAFPMEWMGVLMAGWLGTMFGAPNIGAGAGLAIYLVLRIAGYGRPDGHLQHWLLWKARQIRSGGRLSAAARACTPRFPYGDYECRDAGCRETERGGRP
jgi:hypothetical protein